MPGKTLKEGAGRARRGEAVHVYAGTTPFSGTHPSRSFVRLSRISHPSLEHSGAEIRERAGLAADEPIHVVAGGPPCQGFSFLGRRLLEDERNVHLIDFLRLVRELRPLVALIENVPLVITSHGGIVIKELCDGLAALGYASCADVLLASDYGVPQFRKGPGPPRPLLTL